MSALFLLVDILANKCEPAFLASQAGAYPFGIILCDTGFIASMKPQKFH
jgi:hypothetical protein